MAKSPIGLGDLLDAIHTLGVTDPQQMEEIAGMLNLSMTLRTKKRDEGALGSGLDGLDALEDAQHDDDDFDDGDDDLFSDEDEFGFDEDPAEDAGPELLPIEVTQESDPTSSPIAQALHFQVDLEGDGLEIEAARKGGTVYLPSLFSDIYQRSTLFEVGATKLEGGEIDIERLLDQVVEQEPITTLPRKQVPSIQAGIHLLIDNSDHLTYFEKDIFRLIDALRSLFGEDRVGIYWYNKHPLDGVRRQGTRTWVDFEWPAPGTPILIFSRYGSSLPDLVSIKEEARRWEQFAMAGTQNENPLLLLSVTTIKQTAPLFGKAYQIVSWHQNPFLRRTGVEGDRLDQEILIEDDLSNLFDDDDQDGEEEELYAFEILQLSSATAYELARYASLADEITRPLLRQLRLRFLPNAAAEIEALVWESEIVERRSPEKILFKPVLQQALKRELIGHAYLYPLWRMMAEIREAQGLPRYYLLEDDLNYLALAYLAPSDVDAALVQEKATEADHILGRIARTLLKEEDSNGNFIRWVIGLLSRLPQDILQRENAIFIDQYIKLKLSTRVTTNTTESSTSGEPVFDLAAQIDKLAEGLHEVGVGGLGDKLVLQYDPFDHPEGKRIGVPNLGSVILTLHYPDGSIEKVELNRRSRLEFRLGSEPVSIRTINGQVYHVTRVGQPKTSTATPASLEAYLEDLRAKLTTSVTLDELRNIAFDFEIDHDSLLGDRKTEKVANLIQLLQRQDRLDQFIDYLRQEYPRWEWPDPPPNAQTQQVDYQTVVTHGEFLDLLAAQLMTAFSQEELVIYFFDFGLDWRDYLNTSSNGLSQELVNFVDSRPHFSQFFTWLNEDRPQVTWPVDLPSIYFLGTRAELADDLKKRMADNVQEEVLLELARQFGASIDDIDTESLASTLVEEARQQGELVYLVEALREQVPQVSWYRRSGGGGGGGGGPAHLSPDEFRPLRQLLSERLNIDELVVIAFDFDIDLRQESFGLTKNAHIVTFIDLLNRDGQMPIFFDYLRKSGPYAYVTGIVEPAIQEIIDRMVGYGEYPPLTTFIEETDLTLPLLRERMTAGLTISDLKTITLDLNGILNSKINFDGLPSDTRQGKVVSLLQQLNRQNQVPALVSYLQSDEVYSHIFEDQVDDEPFSDDPDVAPFDSMLIADVTVGMEMVAAPGMTLNKVWRVKNSGSRAWGEGIVLGKNGSNRFIPQLEEPHFVAYCGPGEEIELSVELRVPEEQGIYSGEWRLRLGPDGEFFGDILNVRLRIEPGLAQLRSFSREQAKRFENALIATFDRDVLLRMISEAFPDMAAVVDISGSPRQTASAISNFGQLYYGQLSKLITHAQAYFPENDELRAFALTISETPIEQTQPPDDSPEEQIVPNINSLSGPQMQALLRALMDRFDMESFVLWLRVEFDRDIRAISSQNSFDIAVLDTLRSAQREGWLTELVARARDRNPQNEALLAFIRSLQEEVSKQEDASKQEGVSKQEGASKQERGAQTEGEDALMQAFEAAIRQASRKKFFLLSESGTPLLEALLNQMTLRAKERKLPVSRHAFNGYESGYAEILEGMVGQLGGRDQFETFYQMLDDLNGPAPFESVSNEAYGMPSFAQQADQSNIGNEGSLESMSGNDGESGLLDALMVDLTLYLSSRDRRGLVLIFDQIESASDMMLDRFLSEVLTSISRVDLDQQVVVVLADRSARFRVPEEIIDQVDAHYF